MLDNFTYPADIFPSSRFYRRDLGVPALDPVPGPDGSPQVVAPDVPGIGTEPDEELLRKFCVSHARIGQD
jgi:hypothetical protein